MVSVHLGSSFSLLVSDPANQIFEMECHQMKSVISLVDSLVRSAQVRRSRIRNTSPTDFSICSILGLESEVTQSSSISGKINVTRTVYAVIASGFFPLTVKYKLHITNRKSVFSVVLDMCVIIDNLLYLRVLTLTKATTNFPPLLQIRNTI